MLGSIVAFLFSASELDTKRSFSLSGVKDWLWFARERLAGCEMIKEFINDLASSWTLSLDGREFSARDSFVSACLNRQRSMAAVVIRNLSIDPDIHYGSDQQVIETRKTKGKKTWHNLFGGHAQNNRQRGRKVSFHVPFQPRWKPLINNFCWSRRVSRRRFFS